MIVAILEAAIRALVVALIVWGGLRLLRVRNVLAQKAAWGLILAAGLAMPALMRLKLLPVLIPVHLPSWLFQGAASSTNSALNEPSSLSLTSLAQPSVSSVSSHESRNVSSGRYPAPIISQAEFTAPRNQNTQLASNVSLRGQFFNEIREWQTASNLLKIEAAAGATYLLVAAVLLIRLFAGFVACLRLWMSARPIFLSADSGVGASSKRVRESAAVSSPVTIGSGVLLPRDWVEWDAEKLRIVLAHEDSHVRQGDFYLQTLAGLHAALFWFSPLGWWLKRKLSDLGETISDRAGLEMAANPVSYAQILLEFAASPRPTLIGVAMARQTNLSQRIERFLNESSFRQAFAGGRRRIYAAVLLVPAALLAGTALVRVEAQSEPVAPPAPASVPIPAAAPSQDAVLAPARSVEPATAPEPPSQPAPAKLAAPSAPAPPPAAAVSVNRGEGVSVGVGASQSANTSYSNGNGPGYSYSYSSNGDSWALVTDGSQRITFNGDWHDSTREEVEKARKLSNGKFLWFTHDGKSYFVDDPATLAQIEAMYKPIEALGRQQEELGRKQEELGRQQEALGRKQEEASIPTPDISKEMARLNEAVAKLDAKKGSTVNQEELADLEGKLGEIQGRLGQLQGEVGAKQGEFGRQQGELGAKQGELGAQQGRLGAEQGRLSQEADRKVKSIIDSSLRDGKAKPVQ